MGCSNSKPRTLVSKKKRRTSRSPQRSTLMEERSWEPSPSTTNEEVVPKARHSNTGVRSAEDAFHDDLKNSLDNPTVVKCTEGSPKVEEKTPMMMGLAISDGSDAAFSVLPTAPNKDKKVVADALRTTKANSRPNLTVPEAPHHRLPLALRMMQQQQSSMMLPPQDDVIITINRFSFNFQNNTTSFQPSESDEDQGKESRLNQETTGAKAPVQVIKLEELNPLGLPPPFRAPLSEVLTSESSSPLQHRNSGTQPFLKTPSSFSVDDPPLVLQEGGRTTVDAASHPDDDVWSGFFSNEEEAYEALLRQGRNFAGEDEEKVSNSSFCSSDEGSSTSRTLLVSGAGHEFEDPFAPFAT